jgi:hypothetical protein
MTAELLGLIAVGCAFLSSIILVLFAGLASFRDRVEQPPTREAAAPRRAMAVPSPENNLSLG